MFATVSWATEILSTVSAFVRLLSSVNTRMHPQGAGTRKLFVTVFTFVRFLSSMSSQVSLQMTRGGETCTTGLTRVRPCTAVYAQMGDEISALRETLITVLTAVRFISSMRPHVNTQRIRVRKRLFAGSALVFIAGNSPLGILAVAMLKWRLIVVAASATWGRRRDITQLATLDTVHNNNSYSFACIHFSWQQRAILVWTWSIGISFRKECTLEINFVILVLSAFFN